MSLTIDREGLLVPDPALVKDALGDKELAERHYGPGPHPGTGTEQEIHAGNRGNFAEIMQDPSIKKEYERGKSIGVDYIIGFDKQLDFLVEFARVQHKAMPSPPPEIAEKMKALGLLEFDADAVRERWRKRLENVGEPDSEFVAYVMKRINDTAEAFGMTGVPVLIRRHMLDLDGNGTGGQYVAMTDDPSRSYIAIYQQDEPRRWFPRSESFITSERSIKYVDDLAGEIYPDWVQASYIHEYGHHEWHSSPRFGKAHDRAENIIRMDDLSNLAQAIRHQVAGIISRYASERPVETVAEAYSLYVHPKFNEMPEKRQALVKYILGVSDDNPLAP